ncbi:putative aldouronate transport system substrate-binding protein [Paenibacillus sp. 1_12]|uniref:extracellular solute-binding protein n=1 Tax=Paenibacillus sp. 1_12 TaxID=1566278 RepID=UPI0008E51D7F|nr:extracellular solute-binding protein [Paenibacillus sp. 1_12]SFK98360.1 putative aldouronate transport system substrate-binding protein [Paenibacillus sp. 1_12]
MKFSDTATRPKRTLLILSTWVVIVAIAAGCSTPSAIPMDHVMEEAHAPGKPIDIKIMADYTIAQPPSLDNPVLKEFEKRTHTKLTVTWVPGGDYSDRVNVALATGDIADLIKIPNITTPLFLQMVKQGAFWDLTPYVKSYPNLMALDSRIWDHTKIDGKTYAVPAGRPMDGGGFVSIRKDWLNKVGLQMPTDMDELYTVLKAFKEQAPDGKPDTVGYTMRDWRVIEEVFTGTVGKWKERDGKLINMTLEHETKDALVYLNKLYKNGLIPLEFPVMKENQFWEIATSGRAGLTSETPEALFRYTMDQWKKDPSVEWTPMLSLASRAGDKPYVTQNTGFNGVLAVPKTVSEEKMKAILKFIDFGSGGEGMDLALYGIKNVHYTVVDGLKVANDKAVADSIGTASWGKMFSTPVLDLWQYAAGMPKEMYQRNMKIAEQKAKFSTGDPAIGLVSDTELKVGADYTKKIADTKVQVIIGKISLEEWSTFVDMLKKDPTYTRITDEINIEYNKRKALK